MKCSKSTQTDEPTATLFPLPSGASGRIEIAASASQVVPAQLMSPADLIAELLASEERKKQKDDRSELKELPPFQPAPLPRTFPANASLFHVLPGYEDDVGAAALNVSRLPLSQTTTTVHGHALQYPVVPPRVGDADVAFIPSPPPFPPPPLLTPPELRYCHNFVPPPPLPPGMVQPSLTHPAAPIGFRYVPNLQASECLPALQAKSQGNVKHRITKRRRSRSRSHSRRRRR